MKKYIFSIAILCLSQNTFSSVVINQTRVIYPSPAKFVSVQLVNQSDKTHLVQSWFDEGDETITPEKIRVPFTIMPPVVKMAGHSGQILKISSTDTDKLPTDKESVYWLNMLDIPPIPEGSNDSYLQVAIRNRVKLFFRPTGLEAPDSSVGEKISIKHSDGKTCLNNNSPYYMTIPQVITWHGGTLKQKTQGNLLSETAFISPFGCTFVSEKIRHGRDYRITWLDDYGSKKFTVIH